MSREHSTAYAKIVETEQNKFDVFIGKQGTKGLPTYHVELTDKNATCIDLRSNDATPTSYVPKSMSADGKTKDTKGDVPKIVQSLIDQLLKKEAKAANVAKGTKASKPKASKKATKSKTSKPKATKTKGKTAEAVIEASEAEDVEDMPVFNESLDDGETDAVIFQGRKFNFTEENKGGLMVLTVSRAGHQVRTTYGPKDADTETKVTELAQRMIHDFDANGINA